MVSLPKAGAEPTASDRSRPRCYQMIELQYPYRRASKRDANAMAELVNIAGEGLPLYLWSRMAEPGQSAWDVGRMRARRDRGTFSYHNAIVREEQGQVAACVIGYSLSNEPEPISYAGMPAMFVPLQQLEDLATGTWYVNVLATYPLYRGKGYGSALLSIAEQIATRSDLRGMSIIVSEANTGARRLYAKFGYREHAHRPMVKEKWEHPGENWLLLGKDL